MSFSRISPEALASRRAAQKAANLKGLTASRAEVRGTYARTQAVVNLPKIARAKSGKDEQAHKDKLATLGCMVCRRLFPFLAPGPVQLHHLRAGGWGKGDYTTLIPLCESHHTGDMGVHGLGTKGFAKHYGFDQADLLMDALTLAERP